MNEICLYDIVLNHEVGVSSVSIKSQSCLPHQVLFGLLFEYYGDLAIQEPPHFSLMERLLPHIYQLSQMAPLVTGTAVQEVIKSRQTQLNTYAEAHSGRGVYPALDVVRRNGIIVN